MFYYLRVMVVRENIDVTGTFPAGVTRPAALTMELRFEILKMLKESGWLFLKWIVYLTPQTHENIIPFAVTVLFILNDLKNKARHLTQLAPFLPTNPIESKIVRHSQVIIDGNMSCIVKTLTYLLAAFQKGRQTQRSVKVSSCFYPLCRRLLSLPVLVTVRSVPEKQHTVRFIMYLGKSLHWILKPWKTLYFVLSFWSQID